MSDDSFGGNETIREAPLTGAQEAAWRLYHMDPARFGGSNVPVFISIASSRLDLAFSAVCASVRRHETLRTIFVQSPTGPKQYVLPPYTPPLTRVATREELSRFRSQAFDVGELPSLKAAWVEDSPGKVLLVVVTHHLAMDGLSAQLLRDEIIQVVRGLTLPEPQMHPVDIAVSECSEAGRECGVKQANRLLKLVSRMPAQTLIGGDSIAHRLDIQIKSKVLKEVFAETRPRQRPATASLAFFLLLLHILGAPDKHRLHVASGNRWEHDRIRSIGNLAISVPVAIELPRGSTSRKVIEIASAANRNLMRTTFQYSQSKFDAELMRMTYTSGRPFGRSFFNFGKHVDRDDAPQAEEVYIAEHMLNEHEIPKRKIFFGPGASECTAYSSDSRIHLQISIPATEVLRRILEECVSNLPLFAEFFATPSQTTDELMRLLGVTKARDSLLSHEHVGVDLVDLQEVHDLIRIHPSVEDVRLEIDQNQLLADLDVTRPVSPASIHWLSWQALPHSRRAILPAWYIIRCDGRMITQGSGRGGVIILPEKVPKKNNFNSVPNEAYTRSGVTPKSNQGVILSGGSINDAVSVALDMSDRWETSAIDVMDPYRLRHG